MGNTRGCWIFNEMMSMEGLTQGCDLNIIINRIVLMNNVHNDYDNIGFW